MGPDGNFGMRDQFVFELVQSLGPGPTLVAVEVTVTARRQPEQRERRRSVKGQGMLDQTLDRGEALVVGLLLGVIAQVLEQHDLPVAQVLHEVLRPVADAVVGHHDLGPEQLGQAGADRHERILGIDLAIGAPEVARQDDARALLLRELDRRQRRADARVVGDLTLLGGGLLQGIVAMAGSGVLTGALGATAGLTLSLSGVGSMTLAPSGTGEMVLDIYVNQSQATVDQIVAAVWSALAAEYDVAGTMGEKLNGAGTAGDPWTADLTSYASGTAGKKLRDALTKVGFISLK